MTSGFCVVPEVWVRAGAGFGDVSEFLAGGVDRFCGVVGGQPFGGDDLGRGLFEGDAVSGAAGFVQRRDGLLEDLAAAVNLLRGMGAGLVDAGGRYVEADGTIVTELGGGWGPAPVSGVSSGVLEEYRHAAVPGGLPASAPPPGIVREAVWIFEAVGFGCPWPDGRPERVRALQQAATELGRVVDVVARQVAEHSRRVTGSGFGDATEAFATAARVVHGEGGLLADLEQRCEELAAYCRTAAAAILSAQRHCVTSASFVVALMIAVSALGPFLEAGLAAALRLVRLEGLALRIVLRLLYEAVVGATFSGGLDAIDQVYRPGGFNGKELAGAVGQGALAGGLMGFAHAGLPALAGRSPALTALARLMETPGARGITTRFAVGGAVGTAAMATSSALTGHGWDLEHAAETGFGMAFLGTGTELAGPIFHPTTDVPADARPADQRGIAGPLVPDRPAEALRRAAMPGPGTRAPGNGRTGGRGAPAPKRIYASDDGSDSWVVEGPNGWRLGASILRGPDLDRVTALTATKTPEGPVLHVRMRPRFGRPEEYLRIPLDGSPSSPITDATAQGAVARHGSGRVDDQLAGAGFRRIAGTKTTAVWEYTPPGGGPALGARTSGGDLQGIWRYTHDELSAYLTAHPGDHRGGDVVAGPYMVGDRTTLWQAGALRFGLSGLRPDRITHVEVRPYATADDLRPAPAGRSTVRSPGQALTEPLRVIDRLRELGAFPDGEVTEFTWGPDRFRVHATSTGAAARTPGANGGYRYEASRAGHDGTRLVFDSTDIHDAGAHQPSAITDVFGDHARPPRPDPQATHVTPSRYGIFRHAVKPGASWPEPETLSRTRARIDTVITDLTTDPNLPPQERRQRIDELTAIAEHAGRTLSLASREQRWKAPQDLSENDPAVLELEEAANAVLAVHRAVGRYAEAWTHSTRPGALDVAGLDPLSATALWGEQVRLGADLRLPVLQQAKIAALAERTFNADGTFPEFGRHLRHWLVSSVAMNEAAMRMYMGAEAEKFISRAGREGEEGFFTGNGRWLAVRMDGQHLAGVAGVYFHEVVHATQGTMGKWLLQLARSNAEGKVLTTVGRLEREIAPIATERYLLLKLADEEKFTWQRHPIDLEDDVLGYPGPLHAALATHGAEYAPDLETLEAVQELFGDGTLPEASWQESYDRATATIIRRVNSPSSTRMDTPILYWVMKKLGFPLAPPDPGNPEGHRAAIIDLARSAAPRP